MIHPGNQVSLLVAITFIVGLDVLAISLYLHVEGRLHLRKFTVTLELRRNCFKRGCTALNCLGWVHISCPIKKTFQVVIKQAKLIVC